jgi:hypothetical protein
MEVGQPDGAANVWFLSIVVIRGIEITGIEIIGGEVEKCKKRGEGKGCITRCQGTVGGCGETVIKY